jgi:phosphohistidine phosphatase
VKATVRALYVLRHAKSSWDDPALADHERPLALRGQRAAKRIAKHMRRNEVEPELVLCSTATRARETLELLRPALRSAKVLLEDDLYGASADALLARLRRVPDDVRSVLLIGHNPGLQELALVLAREGEGRDRLETKFPTAALATFTLAEPWSRLSPGGAALAGYVVPRDLGEEPRRRG